MRQPWVEGLMRAGLVVRGLIYGAMGLLALLLAFGLPVQTTDQRGAVYLLHTNLFTRILLLGAVVALLAYSLWGFIRAVFDPLHRGDSPAGISSRVGFAWSGLNYLGLAIFAGGLVLGGGGKSGDKDAVQSIVEWALKLPAGGLIVIVAGGVGVISGLAQFVDAYRAGFRRDLKRNQMTEDERMAVDNLGRFGMVARGVIFTFVGGFILQAGLHHEADEAHSFGYAFVAVSEAPAGRVLLGILALGFIALGVHSMANARWVRVPKGGWRRGRAKPHPTLD